MLNLVAQYPTAVARADGELVQCVRHEPPALSIPYIVIDQKPLTGGVASFGKDTVYLFAPVSVCPRHRPRYR